MTYDLYKKAVRRYIRILSEQQMKRLDYCDNKLGSASKSLASKGRMKGKTTEVHSGMASPQRAAPSY